MWSANDDLCGPVDLKTSSPKVFSVLIQIKVDETYMYN